MNEIATAVDFEMHGAVALLRLNDPERRNPLTRAVKAQLGRLIEEVTTDSAVRAIVLTGTGSAFCAGGDIGDMADRTGPAVRKRLMDTQRWARKIMNAPKPAIAAINGAATGGGFGLAMLFDLAIASDQARFRASFPSIGAAPDVLLAYTLPRAVGMVRARDILLRNRMFGAEQALAWGMVNEVVSHDYLLPRALELAAELADGPTLAFELAKGLIGQAYGAIDGFMESEANAQAVAFGSADFAEGVAAFQARRPTSFQGR